MSNRDVAAAQVRDEARALRIHANRLVTSLFAGEYRSVFRGRGIEFEEVREYQDGDDVRAIDWNVTARAGRPFVKRYVEEREMTVMLLLDLSTSLWLAEPRAARRELVLRTCALLIYAAARSQDQVGLLAFSDRVERLLPPAKGMRHARRMLAELVHLYPAGTGTDVAGALDHLCRVQKRRAIVFLVSDFLATDYRLALAATTARHEVVAILPQTELDRHLPAGGLVRVRDAEQGIERLLDSDCARVREAYRSRADQRRAALRRTLLDGGVELLEVTTRETPARAGPFLRRPAAAYRGVNGRVTETSPRMAMDQPSASQADGVLQDVRGAVAPEAAPPFIWSGTVLLLALALWALARRWRRRSPPLPVVTARDHHAELVRLAEDHRAGRLAPHRVALALNALVRAALAESLGLPSASLTAQELRARPELPAPAAAPLTDLLALCDAVKFGRVQPDTGQIARAVQCAGEVLRAVTPASASAGGAG